MDSENHGFGLSVAWAQRVIVCIAKIKTRKFSPSFLIVPPSSFPSAIAQRGRRKPAPEAAGASGERANVEPADYCGATTDGYGTTISIVLDQTVTLLAGSSGKVSLETVIV